MIRFVVQGEPVPKARPRLGANGNVYTPERTRAAEAAVGWAWKQQRPGPPDGLHWFAVEIGFVLGDGRWVDVDNLTKTVLDGLNRLAWKDDRQVRELRAEKRYSRGEGDPPRTEVEVYKLEPIAPGRDHDDQTQARSRSPRPRGGGRPVGGVGRTPVPGEG